MTSRISSRTVSGFSGAQATSPFGPITGPDAIALIDRERPDLVVADLRLPGVDGLAVARHARGRVPPIPVILITAYDSPQARAAARESGVSIYLAKPFANAAFLDAVRRALPPRSTDGVAEG